MILDRFDKIREYSSRIPNLENALQFIEQQQEWVPGRYEFPGGYLLYQELDTKPVDEGTFENHDRYADIQVLLDGAGWKTLWNRVEEMTEAVPYDPVKDATRWNGDGAVLALLPGMFVCFFPTDAHKPDRFLPGEAPVSVRKYVIKLELPEQD